jgi:hypothetical protein
MVEIAFPLPRQRRSFGEILKDIFNWAVVLTNGGEEWVVDKINETVQTKPEYVGWGTGAGTSAKSDTDLFTPATEARVLGTTSKQGTGSSAKYQVIATLTADGSKTITNAGLFTSAGTGSPPSGGLLIIKGDHTGVALLLNDQIAYTWTLDPS